MNIAALFIQQEYCRKMMDQFQSVLAIIKQLMNLHFLKAAMAITVATKIMLSYSVVLIHSVMDYRNMSSETCAMKIRDCNWVTMLLQ